MGKYAELLLILSELIAIERLHEAFSNGVNKSGNPEDVLYALQNDSITKNEATDYVKTYFKQQFAEHVQDHSVNLRNEAYALMSKILKEKGS